MGRFVRLLSAILETLPDNSKVQVENIMHYSRVPQKLQYGSEDKKIVVPLRNRKPGNLGMSIIKASTIQGHLLHKFSMPHWSG